MESTAAADAQKQASYAAAWMTWDTIIHFSVEVECVWRRPTSWVKFVYIFIRYFPILHGGAILTLNGTAEFSTHGCKAWIAWEFVFMELLTLVVESVLVMRVYVLYNQNRIILRTIIALFIAEIILMISALAVSLPRIAFTPHCLTSGSPGFFVTYWLSSLTFETFLFCLTLAISFRTLRSRQTKSFPYVFLRDGTWAFALIFVAMLLNMLLYKLEKTPLAGMGYFYELSVMSFAGSHILLNIRRLGISRDASFTARTMEFAGQEVHQEAFPENDRNAIEMTVTHRSSQPPSELN